MGRRKYRPDDLFHNSSLSLCLSISFFLSLSLGSACSQGINTRTYINSLSKEVWERGDYICNPGLCHTGEEVTNTNTCATSLYRSFCLSDTHTHTHWGHCPVVLSHSPGNNYRHHIFQWGFVTVEETILPRLYTQRLGSVSTHTFSIRPYVGKGDSDDNVKMAFKTAQTPIH